MTRVYSPFLIKWAIVVEPASLITLPSRCARFFSFSPKLSSTQPFCFKASTLITLACAVSFAWRLSLRPGAGEYGERWFVLMMGGDEGETTKGGTMTWDRRGGGVCLEERGWWAPDHGSNEARPSFLPFSLLAFFVYVHQGDLCTLESDALLSLKYSWQKYAQ